MDVTLSSARRFYSSKGDPLVVKGLMKDRIFEVEIYDYDLFIFT